MKNYPLLKTTTDAWIAWTDVYLKTLNNQVKGLYDYSNYFIPDIVHDSESSVLDNLIFASPTIKAGHTTVDSMHLQDLHPNSWIQLTKELDVTLYGEKLGVARPGSYLVSYARAEGEVESNTATIKRQENLYFWIPGGWGSYYMINTYITADNQLIFATTYDKYAEENYGLEQLFAIDFYNCRYYYTNTEETWLRDGNIALSLQSISHDEHTIIAKNQHIWSNITTNPVASELYIQTNNTYEEIDIDSVRSISKVAKTNIANYTIVLKNTAHPDIRVAIV